MRGLLMVCGLDFPARFAPAKLRRFAVRGESG
jgi:hypothetical protein